MVIMIVADQHSVDGRQTVKCYTRLSPAPPSNPGKRTRSFGPGRIGQQVRVPLLEQYGRVVHQSDSQSVASHTTGRNGLLHV
jgi:hypothetical protein